MRRILPNPFRTGVCAAAKFGVAVSVFLKMAKIGKKCKDRAQCEGRARKRSRNPLRVPLRACEDSQEAEDADENGRGWWSSGENRNRREGEARTWVLWEPEATGVGSASLARSREAKRRCGMLYGGRLRGRLHVQALTKASESLSLKFNEDLSQLTSWTKA